MNARGVDEPPNTWHKTAAPRSRLWRFAFVGCGMAESGYWLVDMEVAAFATKAEAEAFQNALIDAFCSMPESSGLASSCGVRFEPDYGERSGGPFVPVGLDDL